VYLCRNSFVGVTTFYIGVMAWERIAPPKDPRHMFVSVYTVISMLPTLSSLVSFLCITFQSTHWFIFCLKPLSFPLDPIQFLIGFNSFFSFETDIFSLWTWFSFSLGPIHFLFRLDSFSRWNPFISPNYWVDCLLLSEKIFLLVISRATFLFYIVHSAHRKIKNH
jgi:hypothetical protein